MPLIKPISDLRNKANEISQIAHRSDEPIFITKNGEGDMVVMSMAHYGKLQMRLDLLGKLAVANLKKRPAIWEEPFPTSCKTCESLSMTPPKYAIRLLRAAEEDLRGIITYIALDNSSAAAAFADKIENRLSSLSSYPLLGKIPDEDELANMGYLLDSSAPKM